MCARVCMRVLSACSECACLCGKVDTCVHMCEYTHTLSGTLNIACVHTCVNVLGSLQARLNKSTRMHLLPAHRGWAGTACNQEMAGPPPIAPPGPPRRTHSHIRVRACTQKHRYLCMHTYTETNTPTQTRVHQARSAPPPCPLLLGRYSS